MIQEKKVLAIIPARGGSKGIPRKNIVKVAGKPLIQYTIEIAKACNYIDEIHVSTDDLEIAQVVESLGINVPRLRPSELAQDETKTIDVVMDVINYYSEQGINFDYMLLLQPTQPLRKVFHIEEALEQIISSETDSLVSVSLVEEHPILMRQIVDGKLKSLLDKESTVRRQDFNPFYIVNGSIYINKINEKLSFQTSLNDNLIPYIMERKYHLDIDEELDLLKFEAKLL